LPVNSLFPTDRDRHANSFCPWFFVFHVEYYGLLSMARKPPKRKLPKHHAGQVRRTVSLSISVPIELESPLNQAAALRGMNRSQFVSWLAKNYLYLERGQLPPEPLPQNLPPLPRTPPRIRRKAS
jgi:hypothetical protein